VIPIRCPLVAVILCGLVGGAVVAGAQQQTVLTGKVVAATGNPVPFAQISIPALSLVTQSHEDGRYTIPLLPEHVKGQTVTVAVRALGFKATSTQLVLTASLAPVDFTLETNPLKLGEVVVTGAGTTSDVSHLGRVHTAVDSAAIRASNDPNVVGALSAKAPGVVVTTNAGDPGASASIQIRGTNTITNNSQPLFVVDGVPIDNSTNTVAILDPQTGGPQGGVASPNRAIDINPDDIASVEVLKGAAAGAIYGARAGQGVILITTKHGRPGRTTTELHSTFSVATTSKYPALQRSYGQGDNGVADSSCETTGLFDCYATKDSWGPKLGPGVPTYNHANEAFKDGAGTDNSLSISGGDEKTSFYVDGSYVDQFGTVVGPHNYLHRSTARLKADHEVVPNLRVGGNVQLSNTAQDAVQKGYNFAGIEWTSYLTPPDFNNNPCLASNGLPRSYQFPFPSAASTLDSRGFDNPFCAAELDQSTTNTNRAVGGLSVDYQPLPWLRFSENLGLDYAHDDRIQGQPQGTSQTFSPAGQVIQEDFDHFQVDQNVIGTATWKRSENLDGDLTLGSNLNARSEQATGLVGDGLLAPYPYSINNTVSQRPPFSYLTYVHDRGTFGQTSVNVLQQIFLKGGLRYDESSTFPGNAAFFPSVSGAWEFTRAIDRSFGSTFNSIVSYGKLRVAYGEVGTEPNPYLGVNHYVAGGYINDAYGGLRLSASQNGSGGVYTPDTLICLKCQAERTREFETGIDLGLFKNRSDFSATYYHKITPNAIIPIQDAPSSGVSNTWENGGRIRNDGIELALNVRPVDTRDWRWEVGGTYASNWNKVLGLKGADFLSYGALGGFNIAYSQLGGTVDTFRDYDYVRCGRGIVIDGYNVDANCSASQKKNHAMFIANGSLANLVGSSSEGAGFPILDPTQRVIGNADPRWTGNVHTSLRWKKWTVSTLIDIREGGLIFNGTRATENLFGTGIDTDKRGQTVTFGSNYLSGATAGPGKGTAVTLDQTWFQNYYGEIIGGVIGAPFYEDGSYIKLRELALGYEWTSRFLTHNLGLQSVVLRIAGRNLYTWTGYKGADPEVDAGGAESGAHGIDYFGTPQTRSLVLTVNIIK
jgi:TonB-linked SusC/RagA family outer membrane protein